MRLLLLHILSLTLTLAHSPDPVKRYHDTHNYYAIAHNVAKGVSFGDVAIALGVEIVEQLGELEDHWVVRSPKLSQDGAEDPVFEAYKSLQNTVQGRQLSNRSDFDSFELSKRTYDSIAFIEREEFKRVVRRAPPSIRRPPTSADLIRAFQIKDPYFPQQWHLANDEYPEHMMNVSGLWAKNITGKGVLVAIVDDGVDYKNNDLADNFEAKHSYDFVAYRQDPTPTDIRDNHGTRCAGQIAAKMDNICGVGIAYGSRFAAIRIMNEEVSSLYTLLAAALNYHFQDISFYSCSWGPDDTMNELTDLSYSTRKALLNGVNKGRRGQGSVFVFASGNGGSTGYDRCNFDGYVNSIYSIAVGAVDHRGLHPEYSESCTAVMIVAYSSGGEKGIVTTDIGKNVCTKEHSGTSAAAPNAVGVFALALQARPDLTWRDFQYLCVETARRIDSNDSSWSKIANGKYYSEKYGFGVLDGWHYVHAAKNWKLVKPQAWLKLPDTWLQNGKIDQQGTFSGGQFILPGGVTSTMQITKEMLVRHNFEMLEHVNVRVWIGHTRRGHVSVELNSPTGIKSMLAGPNANDDSKIGFPGWTFMTLKHWGENPVGIWTIRVSDKGIDSELGHFAGWNIVLWGTTIDPSKAKKYELTEEYIPSFQSKVHEVGMAQFYNKHKKPGRILGALVKLCRNIIDKTCKVDMPSLQQYKQKKD